MNKPRKYRKKPVVIEAVKFLGESNYIGVSRWMGRELTELDDPEDVIEITTLESRLNEPLIVEAGNWVIRGIEGELYPCRDDIFHQTYELAQ